MKLCRFNDDRLGVVTDRGIADVTPALDLLPGARWPIPPGDLLIVHFDTIRARVRGMVADAPVVPADSVRFLSPVANPLRIIAAPVNYRKHQDEANADGGVNFDKDVKAMGDENLASRPHAVILKPGAAERLDALRQLHDPNGVFHSYYRGEHYA